MTISDFELRIKIGSVSHAGRPGRRLIIDFGSLEDLRWDGCSGSDSAAPVGYTRCMIRQIVPVFFTLDIPRTLAYYKDRLGFDCLGTWQDPPVYAIVARDQHEIHFRCSEPPRANPDKYADELLDAYISVENADSLYAEYAAKDVEFTRKLGDTPWQAREFVVKDCDGRLLAFGARL